jgi:hypothetical protein
LGLTNFEGLLSIIKKDLLSSLVVNAAALVGFAAKIYFIFML